MPLSPWNVFGAHGLALLAAILVLVIAQQSPAWMTLHPIVRVMLIAFLGDGTFILALFILRPTETCERIMYVARRFRAIVQVTTASPDTFYVATTGSDTNDGSSTAPFATISRGISEGSTAVASGPCNAVVLVAAGTYTESLFFTSEVSVLGGYTPGTWVRTPGNYSIVQVGIVPATANGVSDATISGLDIRAADATLPGAPSIAARVLMSVGNSLVFQDCKFVAGAGASGTPGPFGSAGAWGVNGVSGHHLAPCSPPF